MTLNSCVAACNISRITYPNYLSSFRFYCDKAIKFYQTFITKVLIVLALIIVFNHSSAFGQCPSADLVNVEPGGCVITLDLGTVINIGTDHPTITISGVVYNYISDDGINAIYQASGTTSCPSIADIETALDGLTFTPTVDDCSAETSSFGNCETFTLTSATPGWATGNLIVGTIGNGNSCSGDVDGLFAEIITECGTYCVDGGAIGAGTVYSLTIPPHTTSVNLIVCRNAGGNPNICGLEVTEPCGAELTTCPTSTTLSCAEANTFANDPTGLFNLLGGVITVDPSGCGTAVITGDDFNPSLPCATGSPYAVTFTGTFTPDGDTAEAIDFSACSTMITVSQAPEPAVFVCGDASLPTSLTCAAASAYSNTNVITKTNGLPSTDPCFREITATPSVDLSNVGACGGAGSFVRVTYTVTETCDGLLAPVICEIPVLEAPEPPSFVCGDAGLDASLACAAAASYTNTTVIRKNNGLPSTSPCFREIVATPSVDLSNVGACGGAGSFVRVTYSVTETCDGVLAPVVCEIPVLEAPEPAAFVCGDAVLPISLSCAAAAAYTNTDVITKTNGLPTTDPCYREIVATPSVDLSNVSACGEAGSFVRITYGVTETCDGVLTPVICTIPVDAQLAPDMFDCGDVTLPTTLTCEQAESFATPSVYTISSGTGTCLRTLAATPSLVPDYDDCGGTLTVRYVVSETCDGMLGTVDCDITITAAATPTITVPDLPATLDCNQAAAYVPTLGSYTNGSTGACEISGVITPTVSFTSMACNADFEVGTVTVTYTIPSVDLCPDMVVPSSTVIIPVVDAEPPVLLNCPADMTMNVDGSNCDATVKIIPPIATDDCDDSVDVTWTIDGSLSTAATVTIAAGSSSSIEFTATDDCGRTSTCSYTVTIVDNENPVIICPPNLVVCADDGICTWAAVGLDLIYALEDCGYTTTHTISSADGSIDATDAIGNVASGTAFPLGVSTITYTITETLAVANSATCSFIITVEDCEAPEITCPTNVTDAVCGTSPPATFTATATDNCDMVTDIVISSVLTGSVSGCGDTETLIYEFTATDAAGNSSTCQATFATIDNIAPVITDASDLILVCDGADNSPAITAWLNTNGGSTVTTETCGDVSWTHNFSGLVGSCPQTAMVTFTATDECGNFAVAIASISIDDTTAPEITAPSNITIECDSDVTAILEAWSNGVLVIDACDSTLEPTIGSSFIASCGSSGVWTYTFDATDACGNAATQVERSVTITDTQKPVIMVPPSDLVLECDGTVDPSGAILAWTTAFGGIVGADGCTDVSYSFTAGTAVTLCGTTTVTPYTFTVTDECGNSISEVANVTIEDTTNPTVIPPTAGTADCASPDVITWANGVSATDVGTCSSLTTSYSLINEVTTCTASGWSTVYTYVFTAIDDCGNAAAPLTSTYTVTDMTAPTFTAGLTGLELTCGDDYSAEILAWIQGITATDDCNDVNITNDYDGSLPDFCGDATGVSVTFTATDGCLTTDLVLAITATTDAMPPVFLNCPADMTVGVDVDACTANVIYSTPIAEDCNGATVAYTSGIESGMEFPLGDTDIVFTATDGCGLTTTCEFTITVIDTDDPQIFCPSTPLEFCADAGTCTWASTSVTDYTAAFENCPGFTITHDIVSADASIDVVNAAGVVPAATAFPLGTSTITYEIIDANGNPVSLCSFTVTILDCEAPDVCSVVLDDLANECATAADDVATWIADTEAAIIAIGDVSACSEPITVTTELVVDISQCGNTFEQTYEFIVIDAAGNSSACLATFSTIDTTDPVITPTTPFATTVECNGFSNYDDFLAWLINNGGLTEGEVSETCGSFTWANDFEITDGFEPAAGCNGADRVYLVNVDFWVVDECGNMSNVVPKRFRIEDTTPPEITAPVDITLECGFENNDDIIGLWLDSYNAQDICDSDLMISNDYTEAPLDCNADAVTVTWTAEDACGNTDTDSATITIIDTTKPDIMVPPSDLVLECDGTADPGGAILAWTTAFGGIVGVDGCTDVSYSFTAGTAVTLCGTTTVTPYTFTVTDECGNSISEVANVTIEDTTNPTVTPPTAGTADCASPDVIAWANGMSATDVGTCSSLTTNYSLINEVTTCTASGWSTVYTYVFTAIDDCGNAAAPLTSTYTVTDMTAPTFTAGLTGLELTCGDDYSAEILAWIQGITATDDCNDVIITNDYDGSLPDFCGDATGVSVTFTASDGCLTTDLVLAITATTDAMPPVFLNCPADMTVGVDVDACTANVIYSTPIAEDCNGATVAYTSGIESGMEFPLGDTDIVFTATDGCGLMTTCEFTITVIDTDDPQIFCPSTPLEFCADAGTCTWASTSVTDYTAAFENCPGFTITHDIVSADASIDVVDAAGVVPAATAFPLGTSTITYEIMDNNTNMMVDMCSFTVTILDCEAPDVCSVVLDDLANECATAADDVATWIADTEAAIIAIGDVSACSEPVTVTTELVVDISQCGNTFEQVYMYTVTDAAGNSSTCLGTFSTADTAAPIIDATGIVEPILECNGNDYSASLTAWLNSNAGLTASDMNDCNAVTWSHNYGAVELSDLCSSTGVVVVTFTATDACGNSVTQDAMFTIQDTTPPVVTCPTPIVLECGDPLNDAIINAWKEDVTSIDACDGTLATTDDYDAAFVGGCGLTGVYTVTFSTIDACGNPNSCESTITIVDTTPPVLACPDDLILECAVDDPVTETATWIALATATDICDADGVDVVAVQGPVTEMCGLTTTTSYLFTATDDCGNFTTCIRNVIVEDNTPPSIDTPPTAPIEECDGLVAAGTNAADLLSWLDANGNAVASDLCSDEALVWSNELLTIDDECGNTVIYTYRFTVQDNCGNESTVDGVYTIEDTTPPTITDSAMADITVECNGSSNSVDLLNWLNDNAGATAVDNCSNITWSNDYGTFINGGICDGEESVTVVFTATDDCGNTSITSATLTIDDSTAPSWEIQPVALTIECDGTTDPNDQIQAWLDTHGNGEAEDDCSVITYSNDFTALTIGCGANTGSALVTFTATDACGNSIDASPVTVTIIDTTAPYITSPAKDITVECDGAGNMAELMTWLDNSAGALVEDQCNTTTWDTPILMQTLPGCGGTQTFVYMFTATDECGNTSAATIANFIIEDTTMPDFTPPADMDIPGCAGTVPNLLVGISGTDLCGGSVTFIQNPLPGELFGPDVDDIILVDITATDECGNEHIQQVTLTIIDDENPYFVNCPLHTYTVSNDPDECTAFVNWSIPVALDNCEDLMSPDQIVQTTGPAPGSVLDVNTLYTVTYVATDAVGLTATCTFDILVVDTQDPILMAGFPEDITLECDDFPGYEYFMLQPHNVMDNCTEESDIFCEVISLMGDDPTMCDYYQFEDTLKCTVTDEYGNFMVWKQVLTWIDTVAPTIVLPPDVTIECSGLVPDPVETGSPEVTDNCAAEEYITVEFMDMFTQTCSKDTAGVIIRIWKAEDPCGNMSQAEQTIVLIDNSPPIIQCAEDVTVSLGPDGKYIIDEADVIAFASDCFPILTYDFTPSKFTCSDLGENALIVKVYDPCGRVNYCTTTVTVIDDLAPILDCPNTDITLDIDLGDCLAFMDELPVTSNDCNVQITTDPPLFEGLPVGTQVVTFTATDASGNTSSCDVNVTVNDIDYAFVESMACNDHINVSLDQWCQVILNADMILEGNAQICDSYFCLEITDAAGNIHDNFFDVSDINETFTVSVVDCNGGNNSCWGTVTIEEKSIPDLICPVDVDIYCNDHWDTVYEDPENPWFGKFVTGHASVANCEPGSILTWSDEFTDFGQCANPRAQVIRTWTVVDAAGNQVDCEQLITVLPCPIQHVEFPEDYSFDSAFECSDVMDDPSLISIDSTGVPTLHDSPLNPNDLCMISYNYEDDIFDYCGGTYAIRRMWTVWDMCTPDIPGINPIMHTQIIKIDDTEAPILHPCPEDITVSANPWTCTANVEITVPEMIDDHCGNFYIDMSMVHSNALIQQEVNADGSVRYFVDNLSVGYDEVRIYIYDDCNNYTVCQYSITVIDDVPPTPISLEYITVSLTGNKEGNGSAILYAENVDSGSHDGSCGDVTLFIRRTNDAPYCNNIGNNNFNNNVGYSDDTIIPNNYFFSNDTDGGQYVKFCCEDLAADGDGDGIADGKVGVWLGVLDEAGNYNETWAEVTVEDKLNPILSCPPDATIDCAVDWSLHLAGDARPSESELALLNAPDIGTGVATGFGICGSIAITYRDSYNENTCYDTVNEISRTWCIEGTEICCNQRIDIIGDLSFDPATISLGSNQNVINNPPQDIILGCGGDNPPLEPTWNNAACELIAWTMDSDTFDIESDACRTIINDYSVVNWCTDEEWLFSQVIKIIDESSPQLSVDSLCVAVNDDCLAPAGSVTLTAIAQDEGDCESPWLNWQVLIDLNADWTYDYEFSSYASLQDPNFGTSANELYISPSAPGEMINIVLPQPVESSKYMHRAVWTVSDGCGNNTSFTSEFEVTDKKAPTPYCQDVSSAPMGDDGVEIWACDFVNGGEDNCTAFDNLRFTFSDVNPDEDPDYDSSLKCSAITYTCDDAVNGIVLVDIYTWDECDNVAICQVELTLTGCDDTQLSRFDIAGNVRTNGSENVEGVTISIHSDQPEYPNFETTNTDGEYASDSHLAYKDYQLTPFKDDDHRNGVSTLDILYIQRHILNIQSLNSPYDYIAADVNNNKSITAADMVDIRKLILEVYTEFPSNDSWRFVKEEQEIDIENVYNFISDLEFMNLSYDIERADWIGIKIGDVNGSVIANNSTTISENRSPFDCKLRRELELIDDNTTIHFYPLESASIHGLQLTFNTNSVKVISVDSELLNLDSQHYVINEQSISISWNDINQPVELDPSQPLFSLVLDGKPGSESINQVTISSEGISPEAYDANLDIMNIVEESIYTEARKFAVAQNEPNPFTSSTIIEFTLPKEGLVKVKVFDVDQKLVYNTSSVYPKNTNEIELKGSDLGPSGVYYYQLEYNDEVVTNKMIRIE